MKIVVLKNQMNGDFQHDRAVTVRSVLRLSEKEKKNSLQDFHALFFLELLDLLMPFAAQILQ